MQIVVFDDHKIENFYPLTFTRSTGDLRVGILKLRQRILSYFKSEKVNIIVPQILENVYKERHQNWNINEFNAEETIFINSRTKINIEIADKIENIKVDQALVYQDEIIAARIIPDSIKKSSENTLQLFNDIKKIRIEKDPFWNYIWDFIAENSEYIKRDFEEYFFEKNNSFETETGVTVLDPYNIWIGEGVEIKPGVVLDASRGPIIIDENAEIMSNSVIIGPVYIGKKTVIKALSKIYEGTSIGPVCKIGGEVEETIIQAFTNKQHDGFLGHSYLGEWVNLGADTNNSDLKNNYKNVKCYSYSAKKKVDTNSQFMGTIIADHSKTGINTTINTGTVIGVGCNLFGKDIISDHISSFSWGEGKNLVEYELDKFLETAEIVKSRRKLLLTSHEKDLYKNIKVISEK